MSVFCVLFVLWFPCFVFLQKARAQESLTFTVTPPLIKVNLGPGESWSSSLKIVNSNSITQEIFVSVVHFEPQGEGGRGRLIPIVDLEKESGVLAEWVRVPKEKLSLSPEGSGEIPFSLDIPENAPPGGHYAAILAGTKPPKEHGSGTAVGVSSLISSLLFVEVRGDVIEDGFIRELSAEKRLYQKPEVELALRFQNKGNVHLQPQGEIIIYNMWGRERGRIPINQETQFGNVLPNTTRKFIFKWKGEQNFFEAGIYRVATTISFGREERKNVSAETSFWIIPIKSFLGIGGGSFVVIGVFVWLLRAYVRKVLEAEALRQGIPVSYKSRTRKTRRREQGRSPLVLVRTYHKAIILVITLGIIWFGARAYLKEALQKERTFEIVIPEQSI